MIAVLQTAASKMGSNIIVRQSPAYSSQAQGSVDRFHRTLMGQIRTPRAQLQQNSTGQPPANTESYHGWYGTRVSTQQVRNIRGLAIFLFKRLPKLTPATPS
jgi:hypothetical protein